MQHLLAVVVAVLAWWLATGAVLLAAGRERPRVGLIMGAATILAIAGLAGLHVSAFMPTAVGSYLGFFSALAVWTWHEAGFLTGAVLGPERRECPPGLSGRRRFLAAFATVRDHELAILATAILVVALSASGPNPTGLWAFMLLWGMRIGAKLVIFLGARHSVSSLAPARLSYLTTYFRTDRTSPAVPALVGASLVLFVWLAWGAATASDPHIAVSATLLAAFTGLAIIEILILALPFSDAAFYPWAARATPRPASPETNDTNMRSLGMAAPERRDVSWT